MAITNHDGVVQERYVFDAFGNVNGLASDWNRTFTGQAYDNETGLMLYRNRFYSPELGRFLQRDPIGYRAHDVNLMRYVRNSISSYTDPLGRQVCAMCGVSPTDVQQIAALQACQNLPRNSTISPRESYMGWADGTHNGLQQYTEGPMIAAMRQHEAVVATMQQLRSEMNKCCDNPKCCDLSALSQGNFDATVPQDEYLWEEFSVRRTKRQAVWEFGRWGICQINPWATIEEDLRTSMGSFRYTWEIDGSATCDSSTIKIRFKAFNRAGRKSASGGWLPDDPATDLDQIFYWEEEVDTN